MFLIVSKSNEIIESDVNTFLHNIVEIMLAEIKGRNSNQTISHALSLCLECLD